MESAVFGLIGVALGAALTVAREWWFQYRRNKKDTEYLAIQVSCSLERFVAGCAAVVADDGDTDEHGYNQIQIPAPTFETDPLKVEWKVLPGKLMYEVLDFPYKAELARQRVSGAFEFANPPEYDEGFEERQFQYATLGIAAFELVKKLRTLAALPLRSEGEWNPVAFMETGRAGIELRRKKRATEAKIDFEPPAAQSAA